MSFNEDRAAAMADAIREEKPLVHCVTNYVTVNDCANALLAIGASPLMADDIAEIDEIVQLSDALLINEGTLNERTIRSMRAAGEKASELGVPAILDPVGAGASRLRTETALTLLREIPFAAIRGNFSEIKTLSAGDGMTRGVDVSPDDALAGNLPAMRELARNLAAATGAVIAISGPIDVVSSGEETVAIRNGDPFMARITGTGCMLTALVAAYCGAAHSGASRSRCPSDREAVFHAVVAAVCAMGLAGQKAARYVEKTGLGTGTFRVALIDQLSLMDSKSLSEGMQIERI